MEGLTCQGVKVSKSNIIFNLVTTANKFLFSEIASLFGNDCLELIFVIPSLAMGQCVSIPALPTSHRQLRQSHPRRGYWRGRPQHARSLFQNAVQHKSPDRSPDHS